MEGEEGGGDYAFVTLLSAALAKHELHCNGDMMELQGTSQLLPIAPLSPKS